MAASPSFRRRLNRTTAMALAAMAAILQYHVAETSAVDMSSGEIFVPGKYEVNMVVIDAGGSTGEVAPPKTLLVAAPAAGGPFPVVQFQHGFSLQAKFYSQLITHVASHGFIMVAPQMYSGITAASAVQEIKDAAAILQWIRLHLTESLRLRNSTAPDLTRVAIAGHSRGGKVSYGVALLSKAMDPPLNISALVLIDPVDGLSDNTQTQPPILVYGNHSLNLPHPTFVIGTGLGSVKASLLSSACVPKNMGHANFYADSGAPAYHFVAVDFGHMDVLDDQTGGAFGWATYFLCKNGPNRKDMRGYAGGLMVAFLKSALLQVEDDLNDAIGNYTAAPIRVDPPETYFVEKDLQLQKEPAPTEVVGSV